MPQELQDEAYGTSSSIESLSDSYTGNPRKLKWTKAFRKAAGKEMVVDTSLTFAARRNIPTRYSRELVAKTLTAMSRIEEIRRKRERAFYKNRMAGNKARQREADRKIVAENQHLLPKQMRDATLEEREKDSEDEEMLSDIEEEVSEVEEKVAIKIPVKASKKKKRVAGESMDVD